MWLHCWLCRIVAMSVVLLLLMVYATSAALRPHIILIVADDYGFNDIGYHGSEILTPNLDELAAQGVKLENYYVQPICSPSRSQLMSGRYQIHTGLQHSLIWEDQPYGLPLSDPTLADKMKESGYSTHLVGKWHLGFFKSEYLPTNRGFDSFYGYLTGNEDYYEHTHCYDTYSCGLDLNDGVDPVWTENGSYSTHLFAQKAEEVVRTHDTSRPLFLYLAFQSVHAPLQVPAQYEQPYAFIADDDRRTYAGMVAAMDEAVGNVTVALREAGLWDNSIIVFTTDNGGETRDGGNNWPLRGRKYTYWEGGLRGVSFVSGPALNRHGAISTDLIHITDWFPTLVLLAGGSLNGTKPDGFDQWRTLSEGAATLRMEILHNIDPMYPPSGSALFNDTFNTSLQASIRVGKWKLLTGDPGWSGWVPQPGRLRQEVSAGSQPSANDAMLWPHARTPESAQRGRNIMPSMRYEGAAGNTKNVWLFDVADDPSEVNDLSDAHPGIVRKLLDRLRFYESSAVPVWYPDPDPRCDPKYHGGVWGPWE